MVVRGRLFFLVIGVVGILFLSPGEGGNLLAAAPPAAPAQPFPAPEKPPAGKVFLDSGIDKYNNGNYREALEDLLAALKAPLSPEERILALQYLGFIHMAYNREREATMAFEEAIRLNPALTLDPTSVSPKILEVFRRAKSRIIKIGSLVVTTSPPEAEVFLDGKPMGKTPLNLREISVGMHKVKVVRENHAPEERELEVKENTEASLNFDLILNAGTLSVVSEPAGVTVYIDEVPQGKTPVIIKNILAGERKITLRLEGLDDYTDKLVFKPGAILSMEVKLVESSGTASINSIPAEAEIYIDGKLKGKTPLLIERMPSGKHNLLLVKAGVGKWEGELVVKRGERAELTGELRASMVVIPPILAEGLQPEGTPEQENIRRFLAGLKELGNLNVYIFDQQKYPNLFKDVGILPRELVQKATRETLNPEQLLSSLQSLARELKVDLILIGVYKYRAKGEVIWNLFNLYHVVPDSFESKVSAEEKDIRLFRRRFLSPWRFRNPYLGLVTVETWLSPYPQVIQVQARGPAAQAGIEPGDSLMGIDQQKIKNNMELQEIIGKRQIGDSVALEMLQKKNQRVKTVKLEAALGEIPLDDPRILYNLAMVEMKHLGDSKSADSPAAAARLNLALCYMHFQEWERAAEILEALRFSHEEGICQGTALFRLGQCYEALEQWRRAVEAYKKVMNFPACTLINPDGPLASQEAAIRLQYLTQRGLVR